MFDLFLNFANDILWGKFMVGLIIFTGIIYTLKLNFIQFRQLGASVKLVFSFKSSSNKGISPYEALSTALAGTMGTGNIVGVGAAIVGGGPGAVFWMWISSLLGMVIKYAEVFLSVKYSHKKGGEVSGGPMYYIRDALGIKWLGVIFAIGTVAASFGIGNISQVGVITQQLNEAYAIPPLVVTLLLCIPVCLVVLFGYEWTGKVAAKLVPIVSILYIGMSACVLWQYADRIPWAFSQILGSAFGARQVLVGSAAWGFSEALRLGFARGLFSNEAGLGSSPIAHASAEGSTPHRQGLLGIFEVFADTIVVCTVTALVILVSMAENPEVLTAAVPVTYSMRLVFGDKLAMALMSVAIICFAFTTIISWCFYGCKASEFLFGKGKTMLYRVIFVAMVIVSALIDFSEIWRISDILNMTMAAPNLIALLIFAFGGRGKIFDKK